MSGRRFFRLLTVTVFLPYLPDDICLRSRRPTTLQ